MVLAHGHGVEDFGVDRVLLDVDQVHLLPDALHGGFRAQRSHVCAHEAVGLARNGLRVHVVVELHVPRVDAEDLQPAVLVGHTNVDLAVEAAEAPKRSIDRVRPVRRADDHHIGPGLEPVHEREHLRHDAALDFAVGLVALGSDRVDLVDEDDGGSILLGLLEGLAEVGLGLASHLGHDLRPVDEEEEGPSLIGHGAGDQSLARPRRPVQEDTAGGLDTESLEQSRVAQGQLDHLADLSHLPAASTNVVVAHVVELLLVLTLDRLAFTVDHRVRRHNAVRGWVRLHDLELDRVHGLPHEEEVSLRHGAVGLEEIRLEVHFEEVAGDALDRVVQRQDVDALAVRHVTGAGRALHRNQLTKPHPQVLAHDTVHLHIRVLALVVDQHNAHRLPALLALEQHRVALEELEFVHLLLGQANHRVVVIRGLVHNEPVR
mmetsp:Transcript_4031/g.11812  ORF Transcript_4031/g.11812 Transcript_4031/m.11812 type:complete len:432 (-) Transcript_4031:97-1392(-)